MQIPQRKLGKTGVNVSILGLVRSVGYEKEAKELISRANMKEIYWPCFR